MSVPRTVAEVLRQHVTLEVEGIDRMYLNVYQPRLQTDSGVAAFFRFHRGHTFASSALMDPMSKAFIAAVERFVQQQIPLIPFAKGQRKDDVAKEYRAHFHDPEGIVFVGKAQEKTPVFRTEKRRNPDTGQTYPWIVPQYGHGQPLLLLRHRRGLRPVLPQVLHLLPLQRQALHQRPRVRQAATGQGGHRLRGPGQRHPLLRRPPTAATALRRPVGRQDRRPAEQMAGAAPPSLHRPGPRRRLRYEVSILQAEFSLTQVLDRPLTGRIFFEEVIRENLDLGRPDQVQLIFDRRITKRTPGRFRTRVLTEGVTPSLHIDYKHSRIKQYHKEGRALRTETTINDPRNFRIGKRLFNLPALRRIGFQANRRLLDVQRISQDCAIGEDAFRRVNEPVEVDGQRASALRFADVAVQALLSALLVFRLLPRGFSNRDLRDHWAPLLGKAPADMTPGQMTYHLRRLRLHGLIERIPRTHRYRVTAGRPAALFCTRTYNRLLRPGLAQIIPEEAKDDSELRRAFDQFDERIDRWIEKEKVPA